VLGHAVCEHAVTQRLDHMRTVQAPSHADRQALARELIEHHQQTHAEAIVRLRLHEIVAPHMVAMGGSQSDAASIVEPYAYLKVPRNLPESWDGFCCRACLCCNQCIYCPRKLS
jgi:hypothetical protein